jgi:uncharacterized coiled-coil protein SlyX
MDQHSIEQRLSELESQVAYNQKTIDDLNDVVCRLEPELKRAHSELEVLSHEILRLTEGGAEPAMKSSSRASSGEGR